MDKVTIKLTDYRMFIRSLHVNKLWVASDNTIIPVSEMSVSHIKNTIAKIERERWRLAFLPILKAELQRRIDDKTFELQNLINNVGDIL